MRLDIVGKNTDIVPHLVGRIADRIQKLNALHDDMGEVRVTLLQRDGQYEARVRLLFADQTLVAMQHGLSPDAAIGAALQRMEKSLARRRSRLYKFYPSISHGQHPGRLAGRPAADGL